MNDLSTQWDINMASGENGFAYITQFEAMLRAQPG